MSRLPLCGIFLAACAGLFGPAIVHAEELGRLFFNSQEREVLNQRRLAPAKPTAENLRAKPDKELLASDEVSESVPLPPPRITGQVVRSSGNNTVWVNHNPHYRRGRQ